MKTPLALLMNDLHIDKDNIQEFNKNWDEALSICKERKINEIAIGGDLWTSRASQTLSVLLAVQNAVRKAETQNIYLVIANGNHCKVNQESTDGYSTLLNCFPNVDVVNYFKIQDWWERDIDTMLVTMSYFPENGSFTDMLDSLKEELASMGCRLSDVVLYIHEGIHGALGNMDIPNELPQHIFRGFGKVLVGHYHNRVKIKGTNIEYIGASRQMNFGEDEEKGYTVLYSDGSTEFIKNQVNTRYKTLDLTLEQVKEKDFKPLDRERYKYRLRLICNSGDVQAIDRDELMAIGFNKIEFVTEKVVAANINSTSINEKFDKNGVRSEYVDFCTEKGLDSTLGLKYL